MALRLTFAAPVLAGLLAAPACSRATAAPAAAPAAQQPVNRDAQVQSEFVARVNQYIELRNKVAGQTPDLGTKSEPEEVKAHQAAMLKGLSEARAAAKPGDIFTPDVQDLIRRTLRKSYTASGSEVKAAIQEENPGSIRLRVNAEYPHDVPLTTVPPQVLSALPRLPDEHLEYRFVGRRLLLLDSGARMVVDYMDNALP